MVKKRGVRCTYQQDGRRCPFDGDGDPVLCGSHRAALAHAAKPRSPISILLEAAGDLLQGKPINRDALGAAEDFLTQWAQHIGAGYRPDITGSESDTHSHGQAGASQPWWHGWADGQDAPRRPGRSQPPPHRDSEAYKIARARAAAREVLGFSRSEVITADTLRRRHRELTMQYHPDRQPDPVKKQEMTGRFAIINAARDVLQQELEA